MKNKFLIALLTLPFMFGLFLMLSYGGTTKYSEEMKLNKNGKKIDIKTSINKTPINQKNLKKNESKKENQNSCKEDIALLQHSK